MYIADSKPKVARALLQHVHDREHLMEKRPDIFTAQSQIHHKVFDYNIENHNAHCENLTGQSGKGKTGFLQAKKEHYKATCAAITGLNKLEKEIRDFDDDGIEHQRRHRRKYVYERIKGPNFKEMRQLVLDFLKELVRRACAGSLDKSYPPFDPFTKGKKAALEVIEKWEARMDNYVSDQFKRLVNRRDAELAVQNTARADSDSILRQHSTAKPQIVKSVSITMGKQFHTTEISNMDESILLYSDSDSDGTFPD